MTFTHAQANFIDDKGAALHRIAPARIMPAWRTTSDGRLQARHAWLVNRSRLSELSRQAAGLRLDYKITLLAPVHLAELPADGRVRRIDGLGSCTAYASPAAAVQASCFVAGRQPDLLTARLADSPPDQEIASRFPDFAPNALQLTAGKRHQMILPRASGAGAPRVQITAYEAKAHLARSITVPGLLGGPVSACPLAPAAPPS